MTKLDLPIADKSLGQHFLRDQNVINKICDDFKESAEAIVEIALVPAY